MRENNKLNEESAGAWIGQLYPSTEEWIKWEEEGFPITNPLIRNEDGDLEESNISEKNNE